MGVLLRWTAFVVVSLACCRSSPPSSVADEELEPMQPAATIAQIVASEGPHADLLATQAFSAQRPTYERPHDDGFAVPPAVQSLSAESCATCHAEIAEEWRVSTHAAAWSDVQFQQEILKSDNRWLCLNCHTPLRAQQELWPVGLVDDDVEAPLLVPNIRFDAALRAEGINCAGCHVRDGVIRGPGLADSVAPHPVKVDPDLRSGAACESCHQAVATYVGKSFVCTFNTGDEWRAGPYDDEGTTCVDCHMPRIERPAATGGPVRSVARHWWRGAGIPKVAGVHPPPEANPPGLALSASLKGTTLTVVATNANAGHMLPTGDPERWVQIDVIASHSVLHSERLGQEWTWWPQPEKHGDTRLAPRESRQWTVEVPPTGALRVVATSHRISEQTAAYHHLDSYPRSLETHAIEVRSE